MVDYDSRKSMVSSDVRVNISVTDRILLHLWEQDHQADHYLVTYEMTRPGIAEVCALHPPNVSRSMRDIISEGWATEHTRSIRGDDRRQKTWQLSDDGRYAISEKMPQLRSTKVLLRGRDNNLLEIRADEASLNLKANLTLLQILMHAQHEGVLNFGDIRFGTIINSDENTKPGSISMLSGAHSTYHTRPPDTRTVHGRKLEKDGITKWYKSKTPLFVLSGIAGCGKTTLVSFWIDDVLNNNPETEVMYYPCQPWDTTLGIATSILHRFGIRSPGKSQDPYGVLETIPLKPGMVFNLDLYRRRVTAHLLDKKNLRKDNINQILIILDDVHNIDSSGQNFFGMLLQIAEDTNIRLLMISRKNLSFYDRRDVHTRNRVNEFTLSGLSVEEITVWLNTLPLSKNAPIAEIYQATGGHPLALELLELYGQILHDDWLRFLDEEILNVLPKDHREILALLAVSDRPVPWKILADAADFSGKPPTQIIERGLMLELTEGMWIHEALRSRLLREVGVTNEIRLKKLKNARLRHMTI